MIGVCHRVGWRRDASAVGARRELLKRSLMLLLLVVVVVPGGMHRRKNHEDGFGRTRWSSSPPRRKSRGKEGRAGNAGRETWLRTI